MKKITFIQSLFRRLGLPQLTLSQGYWRDCWTARRSDGRQINLYCVMRDSGYVLGHKQSPYANYPYTPTRDAVLWFCEQRILLDNGGWVLLGLDGKRTLNWTATAYKSDGDTYEVPQYLEKIFVGMVCKAAETNFVLPLTDWLEETCCDAYTDAQTLAGT